MHWAFLMQINLLFLICFLSSFTSRPLTTDNFFVHSLSFSLFVCFTLLFLIQLVFFTHSVYLFSSFSLFSWFFWFYGRFCLFCSLFHSCLFFILPWSFWLLTYLAHSVQLYTSVRFALVFLIWWAIYACLIHFSSAVFFALPYFFACSVNFFSSICFASFGLFWKTFFLHLAYFPCQLLLPSSPLSDGHFL